MVAAFFGSADRGALLAEASVRWLRQSLPGTASRWDIAIAYTFRKAPIFGRKLVFQAVEPGNQFHWELDFTDDAGKTVLEGPLARHVIPNAKLLKGDGKGAVAFNDYFVLQARARRRRIATVLYGRELDLYKRWGIKEIHLVAEWDGRLVWLRRGFVPQDPDLVARSYRIWARERGLDPLGPVRDAAEYPDAFLQQFPELPLYKVVVR